MTISRLILVLCDKILVGGLCYISTEQALIGRVAHFVLKTSSLQHEDSK